MSQAGAREYIYTQQVALPTGGYARAGTSIWLTDQQVAYLDPGLRSVLVDVARAKELERIRQEEAAALRVAGLADNETASAEVLDELRRRRTRKHKQLREYVDTMIRDREDK